MFEFPAIWIWYAFLVTGGCVLFIALLQVANSIRHGARMPLNIFISGIYVVGMAAIIIITMSYLSTVDWSTTFTLELPNLSFLRFGL